MRNTTIARLAATVAVLATTASCGSSSGSGSSTARRPDPVAFCVAVGEYTHQVQVRDELTDGENAAKNQANFTVQLPALAAAAAAVAPDEYVDDWAAVTAEVDAYAASLQSVGWIAHRGASRPNSPAYVEATHLLGDVCTEFTTPAIG